MKKRLSTVIFILVVLIGLSFLLYPTISDYVNRLHQSKAIDEYVKNVAVLEKQEYDRLWEEAFAYNADTKNRINPFIKTNSQKATYEDRLNIIGTGMMGYIEIPSISCNLPIYHGTSNNVLQRAVGHLDWTSLPVGGEGTHSVLSGHRGLPSAKLFTNLSKVAVGDIFVIRVLNESLTYEVEEILIVEPEDTSALQIKANEDLCTLVTCTPYGINTHRLLVRGHRVENALESETVRITADAIQIEPIMVAPVIATPLLIVLSLWLIFCGRKRKSQKGE